MPPAEPLTAETVAKSIDPSVVASAQAPTAATRTGSPVRVAFSHRRQSNEPINKDFLVDTEDRGKVLANTGCPVLQLAEWQGTSHLEVRVAVQVRDDTPLHELEQGGRLEEDETQTGRRAKAKGAVAKLVERGRNALPSFPNRWNAFGECLRYCKFDLVLVINSFPTRSLGSKG